MNKNKMEEEKKSMFIFNSMNNREGGNEDKNIDDCDCDNEQALNK